MSKEHFVIYTIDGMPSVMCAPADVHLMWLDDEERDSAVHAVSVITPDWDEARELYSAMWQQ